MPWRIQIGTSRVRRWARDGFLTLGCGWLLLFTVSDGMVRHVGVSVARKEEGGSG